jgi:hypothetical protein
VNTLFLLLIFNVEFVVLEGFSVDGDVVHVSVVVRKQLKINSNYYLYNSVGMHVR